MLFSGFRKCNTYIQTKGKSCHNFLTLVPFQTKMIFHYYVKPKRCYFFMNKNFSSKCLFLLRKREKNHISGQVYTTTCTCTCTQNNQLLRPITVGHSLHSISLTISFIRERLNQTRRVECDECDDQSVMWSIICEV